MLLSISVGFLDVALVAGLTTPARFLRPAAARVPAPAGALGYRSRRSSAVKTAVGATL
jgi:hypothetical protein